MSNGFRAPSPVVVEGPNIPQIFADAFVQARFQNRQFELQQREEDRLTRDAEFTRAQIAHGILTDRVPEGTLYSEVFASAPGVRGIVDELFGEGASEGMATFAVRPRTAQGQLEQVTLEGIDKLSPEDRAMLGNTSVFQTIAKVNSRQGLAAQRQVEGLVAKGVDEAAAKLITAEAVYMLGNTALGLAPEPITTADGKTHRTSQGFNDWLAYQNYVDAKVEGKDLGEIAKADLAFAELLAKEHIAAGGKPVAPSQLYAVTRGSDVIVPTNKGEMTGLQFLKETRPDLARAIEVVENGVVGVMGEMMLEIRTKPELAGVRRLWEFYDFDIKNVPAEEKADILEDTFKEMERVGRSDLVQGIPGHGGGGIGGFLKGLAGIIDLRSDEEKARDAARESGQPASALEAISANPQLRERFIQEATRQGFSRESVEQQMNSGGLQILGPPTLTPEAESELGAFGRQVLRKFNEMVGVPAAEGSPSPKAGDNFLQSVEFVLKNEGGLNPNDAGSVTNFGIRQADNPDVNVRGLTREGAIQVYRKNYWEPLGFGEIEDPNAARVLFDAGIQHSRKTFGGLVQKALEDDPSIIEAPSVWGKDQRSLINQVDTRRFMNNFRKHRMQFILERHRNNPSLPGLVARAGKL